MKRIYYWFCRIWDDLTFDPDSFSLEPCNDDHEEDEENTQ